MAVVTGCANMPTTSARFVQKNRKKHPKNKPRRTERGKRNMVQRARDAGCGTRDTERGGTKGGTKGRSKGPTGREEKGCEQKHLGLEQGTITMHTRDTMKTNGTSPIACRKSLSSAKYQLLITIYQSPTTNYHHLPDTNHQSPSSTKYQPPTTIYQRPITKHLRVGCTNFW